eukprot:2181584-Pleurochrysis_carterae.AAC.1
MDKSQKKRGGEGNTERRAAAARGAQPQCEAVGRDDSGRCALCAGAGAGVSVGVGVGVGVGMGMGMGVLVSVRTHLIVVVLPVAASRGAKNSRATCVDALFTSEQAEYGRSEWQKREPDGM